MAILKRTKKKEEGEVKEVKAVKAVVPTKTKKGEVVFPKHSIIKKPRITEKAGILAEKGVYTFDVDMRANSQQIAAAIKEAYKVTPVKVSVVTIPAKTMFARGRKGTTASGKKAYVFLKKGDTIDFI